MIRLLLILVVSFGISEVSGVFADENLRHQVATLLKQSWDKNPELRDQAFKELISIGASSADVLGRLSYFAGRTKNETLQYQALCAIENAIGAPYQYSRLQEALFAKEARTRAKAAEVLGLMGKSAEATVEDLAFVLERDGDSVVRFRAANALGLIASHENVAVPALILALHDSDPGEPKKRGPERLTALTSLSRFGTRAVRAIPDLLALAESGKDVIEGITIDYFAIRALPKIAPTQESANFLLRMLRAPSKRRVRTAIINALAELGPIASAAVPDVVELLNSKSSNDPESAERLACACARALGRLAHEKKTTLTVLISVCRDKGRSNELRRAAFIGIGEFGAQADSALPYLIICLNDSAYDPFSQLLYQTIFHRIGTAAINALCDNIKQVKGEALGKTLRALSTFGPKAEAALPLIRPLLNDPLIGFEAQQAYHAIEYKIRMIKQH